MLRIISVISLSIFITFPALGQETGNVVVYQGRKAPFKEQKVLDLSYQNLTEVPNSASNLEIEILILDNNNIQKLPNWIANLKNLKVLSVRNNNLTEFNSVISFCDNLQQLFLSGNKYLADLPNLASCENLELIDVTNTGITDLPGWVTLMDSLFYFKYTER